MWGNFFSKRLGAGAKLRAGVLHSQLVGCIGDSLLNRAEIVAVVFNHCGRLCRAALKCRDPRAGVFDRLSEPRFPSGLVDGRDRLRLNGDIHALARFVGPELANHGDVLLVGNSISLSSLSMGILQSIPLYPFSDDLSSPLTLMFASFH